jgi:hypothetical protein
VLFIQIGDTFPFLENRVSSIKKLAVPDKSEDREIGGWGDRETKPFLKGSFSNSIGHRA